MSLSLEDVLLVGLSRLTFSTNFGLLVLRKISKIVATRCLDFSSKCTKMRVAAGLRPDPLGELERSPRPPSRKKGGLLLRGGEREGRERGMEGREGRERGERGRKRRGGGGKGGRKEGKGSGIWPDQ